MRALVESAGRIAEERRDALVERFAALVAERLPGAVVSVGREDVVVRGRGLAARRLSDPELRFFPRIGR